MKLGNVATGRHFYNRTEDLIELWEKLADDHLTLGGPRRLGKTSVLHKLVEQALEQGYQAEVVDVQGCDTAQTFIDVLIDKHPTLDKMPTSLSDKIPLKSVKLPGFGFDLKEQQQKTWQQTGDFIMTQLAAKKHLILVDEFSIFLETLFQRNPDEAVDFLGWLRRWRVKQNQQWKFVFTGSIGLHALLEKHGLEAEMNDCFDYILGPFKRKHAIAMLQHFAAEKHWLLDEADAKNLCDKIGWLSPFFANLLLNESIAVAKDRDDGIITEQDINQGYERLLASRSGFSHWESRLKKHLSADEFTFCVAILTDICKSADGLNLSQLSSRLQRLQADVEKREQLIKKLRILLTDEGYLSSPDSDGKVHFLSFLLKDYWKRNHG